jgi:hypothetical protein
VSFSGCGIPTDSGGEDGSGNQFEFARNSSKIIAVIRLPRIPISKFSRFPQLLLNSKHHRVKWSSFFFLDDIVIIFVSILYLE